MLWENAEINAQKKKITMLQQLEFLTNSRSVVIMKTMAKNGNFLTPEKAICEIQQLIDGLDIYSSQFESSQHSLRSLSITICELAAHLSPGGITDICNPLTEEAQSSEIIHLFKGDWSKYMVPAHEAIRIIDAMLDDLNIYSWRHVADEERMYLIGATIFHLATGTLDDQ